MPIEPHSLIFRPLADQEQKPYELLLLADPSREMIDKYLTSSQIFVVEQDKGVIGIIVLQTLGNSVGEIKNVAVLPERQGQGIGKYLIDNIIHIARQKNFKIIKIGTSNSGVGQLYLYQKLGFEITEIKKLFFVENYREPIFENGIQAKHLIMLTQAL